MKHPLFTHSAHRALSLLLALSLCLSLLCACQSPSDEGNADDTPIEHSGALITPVDPVEADDASEQYQPISGSFSVTSENGACTPDGNRYVITAGGEYTLRGVLEEGQVYVNAPDQKVTLLLDGASMSSSQRAVVFVEDADSVTIKSAEGSYNELFDRRPMRAANVDDRTTGSGCIFADADLKLSGKGALVITSTYAHGVHTKKDLEIKNVTLKVSAPDCALRGNDSVSVESGELLLISSGSDGIKTSNSDVSSKGNQRGTVAIAGATVSIYAACDGIDAAYDVLLGMADPAAISIYTDTYSSYTSALVAGSVEKNPSEGNARPNGWNSWFGFGGMSEGNASKSSHSAKGIKAHNTLTVKSGTLIVNANDDALHAVGGELLENGSAGKGLLYVDGGTLSITCADDALHADTELIVSGGQIGVLDCYEGLESNIVTIKGGYTTVYADDDGVNASSGASTPTIRVSGGYLSITVGSGDTDALDTNGVFEQTGGTVVVRGGSTGMASALDIEHTCIVTGGTLVVAGNAERIPTPTEDCCMVIFGTISTGMGGGPGGMGGGPGGMGGGPGGTRPGGRSTTEQSGSDAATSTVTTYTVEGTTISFTLEELKSLWIMSDQIKLGQSYTLHGGNDSISWTQSAVKTQAK